MNCSDPNASSNIPNTIPALPRIFGWHDKIESVANLFVPLMLALFRHVLLGLVVSGIAWADWPESFGLVDWAEEDEANGPIAAFGDGLMAVRTGGGDIVVADANDGSLLLRLSPSDEALPVTGGAGEYFKLNFFASSPVAEGDRLAVFCNGTKLGGDAATYLTLWEVPGGRLIGVREVPLPVYPDVFVSLSSSALLLFSSGDGNFDRWNAEDFAEKESVPLPDGFDGPEPEPQNDGSKRSWHGERYFAYVPPDSTQEIVVVDLETAEVEKIPMPDEYLVASYGIRLAGYGNTCLVPAREVSNDTLGGAFFNLEERRFDRYVVLSGLRGAGPARGFYSDAETWFMFAEDRLFPGMSEDEGEVQGIDLRLDNSLLGSRYYGLPYRLESGYLWFSPNYLAPDEVFAYRVPLENSPSSILWVTSSRSTESAGHATVELHLDPPLDVPVTLQVETVEGTALAGEDFVSLVKQITIPAGVTSLPVTVSLQKDGRVEGDEWFDLRFSGQGEGLLFPVPETRVIIEGSTYTGFGMIEPWAGDPSLSGTSVALSDGWLVQGNESNGVNGESLPRVVRKPLSGGEWLPSTTVQSFSEMGSQRVDVRAVPGGRVRIDTINVTTIYDPAEDLVVFQGDDLSDNAMAVGDGVLLGHTYSEGLQEFSWDPAGPSRPVDLDFTSAIRLAYSDRFIISGGWPRDEIGLVSRTDGRFLRTLFDGLPWGETRGLAALGDSVVVSGLSGAYCIHLDRLADDGSGPVPEVIPLRHPVESPIYASAMEVSDERVLMATAVVGNRVDVDVFRLADGEWMGRYPAYLPHDGLSARTMCLSGDGSDVLLSVESINGLSVFHFSLEQQVPRVIVESPVREGGVGVSMRLSEAAPESLVVHARPVDDDVEESDRWGAVGESVIVPAGATGFLCPLSFLDNQVASEPRTVRIEVTVESSEGSGVQRVELEVLDNDTVDFSDVAWTTIPKVANLSPFGRGWIGFHSGPGMDTDDRMRWSAEQDFSVHQPLYSEGIATANRVVGNDEEWAALRVPEKFNNTAAKVVLFKPREPSLPTLTFEGRDYLDDFGHDVLIDDGFVWIGAPWFGREITMDPQPGRVSKYDLSNGRLTKWIIPQNGVKLSFGSRIVRNAESVWISSPQATDEKGAISQYLARNYLRQRIIWEPRVDENLSDFGGEMGATDELLVVRSLSSEYLESAIYDGFSTATGEHLWTLKGTESMALVGDRVLVLSIREGLNVYDLSNPSAPTLAVFIKRRFVREDPWLSIKGTVLAFNSDGSILVDLRQFRSLWPVLGIDPGAGDVQSLFDTGSSPLALEKEGSGWSLALPTGFAPPSEGRLTIECSSDLSQWRVVGVLASNGLWEMVPDDDGELLISAEEEALLVPLGTPDQFFRLHWK